MRLALAQRKEARQDRDRILGVVAEAVGAMNRLKETRRTMVEAYQRSRRVTGEDADQLAQDYSGAQRLVERTEWELRQSDLVTKYARIAREQYSEHPDYPGEAAKNARINKELDMIHGRKTA
jgi:hypothetical protein